MDFKSAMGKSVADTISTNKLISEDDVSLEVVAVEVVGVVVSFLFKARGTFVVGVVGDGEEVSWSPAVSIPCDSW